MRTLCHSPRTPSLISGSLAAAVLLAAASPAFAGTTDISQMLGTGTSLSFGIFLQFLEGPFAQVVGILIVIGAIWRLRQNFEWGEAGTTLALILVGVGMLALFPTIWSHFGTAALL